jgi:hypothetical protein
MCVGRTAPALAGTQPSAPNLPKEARAQPPLSFLAASFFSLKLKKSVEVPTMKFLLSLAGSKHATYFRSLGLVLMAFIVAMGLAPGAQAQYYKYTALDTFTGLQKRFFRTQW